MAVPKCVYLPLDSIRKSTEFAGRILRAKWMTAGRLSWILKYAERWNDNIRTPTCNGWNGNNFNISNFPHACACVTFGGGHVTRGHVSLLEEKAADKDVKEGMHHRGILFTDPRFGS
jgi:hypothetical protein